MKIDGDTTLQDLRIHQKLSKIFTLGTSTNPVLLNQQYVKVEGKEGENLGFSSII